MAGRIKGITVEIGGDTTGLDKALQSVNKQIKSTQSHIDTGETQIDGIDITFQYTTAEKSVFIRRRLSAWTSAS